MTLAELMDKIEIQGDVRIRLYDSNIERHILDGPITCKIQKRYANREVAYLYPGKTNEIVIEITEE